MPALYLYLESSRDTVCCSVPTDLAGVPVALSMALASEMHTAGMRSAVRAVTSAASDPIVAARASLLHMCCSLLAYQWRWIRSSPQGRRCCPCAAPDRIFAARAFGCQPYVCLSPHGRWATVLSNHCLPRTKVVLRQYLETAPVLASCREIDLVRHGALHHHVPRNRLLPDLEFA